MIDVKELSIGDWVSLDGEHFQVTNIGSSSVDTTYGGITSNEFIDPVPLTDGILAKNGFHTYGESYFIPENECNAYVRIGFHKRETVIDLCRQGVFSIQISCKPEKLYVHQLQQLLRLVGIEKEITI